MITVYDMTAGTFRKELEVSNNTEGQAQPTMVENTAFNKELQLQEVELKRAEVLNSMPAHMVNAKIANFIKTMK